MEKLFWMKKNDYKKELERVSECVEETIEVRTLNKLALEQKTILWIPLFKLEDKLFKKKVHLIIMLIRMNRLKIS